MHLEDQTNHVCAPKFLHRFVHRIHFGSKLISRFHNIMKKRSKLENIA